ncbi:hypothetical protein B1F79_03685 [Coxiella-like endosymbiont of Rhipicephalus sanguineus]|nr:hypothetical protein [Coxiella-like endosymbiont of Rhipicephalus sanguineus]
MLWEENNFELRRIFLEQKEEIAAEITILGKCLQQAYFLAQREICRAYCIILTCELENISLD